MDHVLSEEITVHGVAPDNGIFDPAPAVDGSNNLWMSYSVVNASADPVLAHVSTRIASSTDGGLTWRDAGVAPNNARTFQVPDGSGGTYNATWQYEVSRLVYDPYDGDPRRRWKLLWHRFLGIDKDGSRLPLFREHGWIGLSTAPAPGGPWAAEQNLFTGSGYDPINNARSGAPKFDLPARFPGLRDCVAFTEPGVLVRREGIYVSLLCASAPASAGKIVLLDCSHDFASCEYRGDFLRNEEAAHFSRAGQNLAGFSATELASTAAGDYLIVTPNEPSQHMYRGCLVFEIVDLARARLLRSGDGSPVLVERIEGGRGTFRGACGYHPALAGSGVLLSQHTARAPQFHIVATHVVLP